MNHLSTVASAFVERIKINHVWRETRGGRVFWLKRRRSTALPVIAGANMFFRLAGAPMQTLTDTSHWRCWEMDSFLGLHGGDGFEAFTEGDRTIGAEEVPGTNVTIPLDTGRLTPQIAAAVGRELCRAHSWIHPESGAPWSHSDAHAGNFIYEPESDRARIIDFEVMHHPHLSPDDRHADDVLGFLQDIVGRIRAEQWLPCAQSFLSGYDRTEIVERVLPQLNVPRSGAARLWWRVRTSFLPSQELEKRIQALLSIQAKAR